jgi:UPF0755 protein
MKRKRRSGCGIFFVILILGVLCILAIVVGIAFLGMPETLVDIGPASSALEPVERVSLTGYLLLHLKDLNSPLSTPSQTVDLMVLQGDSAATVVAKLEASEFIRDGTLLRNYLRYRGLDTSIEAGGYILNGGMTVREVAESLQSAKNTDWSFTVVEGWRKEQIAQALGEANLGIDPDEFLQAANSVPEEYSLSGRIPSGLSLDGYLFPDTYSLDHETSALDFVIMMIENLESRITPEMMAGFQVQGLDLHQAITLASLLFPFSSTVFRWE